MDTAENVRSDETVNVNDVRAAKAELLRAFNMHLMKAGQTQAALARIARVHPQTIQQVVKGESRNEAAIGVIKSFLPAFWHDHLKPLEKDRR